MMFLNENVWVTSKLTPRLQKSRLDEVKLLVPKVEEKVTYKTIHSWRVLKEENGSSWKSEFEGYSMLKTEATTQIRWTL